MPQEFNGCQRIIWEQRTQIEILFEQSPSLKTFWEEYFESAWGYAFKKVTKAYNNCISLYMAI